MFRTSIRTSTRKIITAALIILLTAALAVLFCFNTATETAHASTSVSPSKWAADNKVLMTSSTGNDTYSTSGNYLEAEWNGSEYYNVELGATVSAGDGTKSSGVHQVYANGDATLTLSATAHTGLSNSRGVGCIAYYEIQRYSLTSSTFNMETYQEEELWFSAIEFKYLGDRYYNNTSSDRYPSGTANGNYSYIDDTTSMSDIISTSNSARVTDGAVDTTYTKTLKSGYCYIITVKVGGWRFSTTNSASIGGNAYGEGFANEAYIYVIVDGDEPTVTATDANGTVLSSKGLTNADVTVTAKDASSGIDTLKYYRNTSGLYEESATKISTTFSYGTTFSDEGNYTIKATDVVGNYKLFYFTIDKTAPTLTLSGVTDGGFTSGSVSASWSTDTNGPSSTARANSNDVLTVKYSYSTTGSFPSSATTAYSSGTSLTAAGNYYMTITDSAGNYTAYTFTIDKTAPVLTLSGVTDGGFTNSSVTATWSATASGVTSTAKANTNDTLTVKYSYLTTSSYPTTAETSYKGASLTEAGNYYMTITDAAGNSTAYTFTIDLTAPVLTLTGVTDGGFTSGSVYATWTTTASGVDSTSRANTNDTLTVTYSSETSGSFPTSADTSYTSGDSLSTAANYYMTITDAAGNYTSYTFTIDKTAPTLTLSGVTDGGFTNGSVSASWSTDSDGPSSTAKANANDTLTAAYSYLTTSSYPTSADTSYTSGTSLSAAGNYYMTITDAAGNVTEYTFTIDKTAPVLTLSGVTDGGFTNGSVSATWTTTASGVASTSRSNSNDTLTVKYTSQTTGSFPSSASTDYTASKSLSTAGNYLMVITDAAGNSTSYTFTIDKTAPALTLSGVTDGGFTNGSVSASWSTSADGTSSTAKANSNDTLTVAYSYDTSSSFPTSADTSYTSGDSLSTAANYYMTITDAAGNSTTYKFTIDKTAPVLTLTGVTNGGFTNGSVSASWSTSASGVSSTAKSNSSDTLTVKYSSETSGSFPSSAETGYTASKSITTAGNYLMVITDAAGNSTSYKFTIDKTAPTLTLSGVTDGGFTNGSVSASWSTDADGVSSTAKANANDTITVKYSSDTSGSFPSSASTSYTSGSKLTSAANYYMTITDKAGNVTTYTFTIDKTAPTLTLTGVTDGGFTNGSVSASWSTDADGVSSTAKSNSNDTLTVKYSYNTTGSFPATVSTSYTSGSISTAGNYLITISDSAGNSTSCTFTIDKTAPTLTLTGVTSGGFTNGSVSASWSTDADGVSSTAKSNSNDTLTVKYTSQTTGSFPTSAGTSYTSGDSLSTAGNYYMTITDAAGNVTVYTFTIDKTAPTLTLSGVTDGGFTNGSVSASWSTSADGTSSTAKANSNDTLTVKYSYLTTSSFPTSASTSYTSGDSLSTAGNYYMTITDAAGNSTTYKFTIDITAPVLTLTGVTSGGFTNGSVSASWSTTASGVASTAKANSNDTITVKYSSQTSGSFPSSAATSYTSGASLSAAGNYYMTITDAAGNVTVYTFTIDKTAPVLTFTGVTDGGYTNGSVTASWSTTAGGTSSTAKANANDTLTVKYSYLTDSSFPTSAATSYTSGDALTAQGRYYVTITDAAGNYTSYMFTIDITTPGLEFGGITYTSGTAMLTNTAFNITVSDYTSTTIYYRLGDSGDYVSYAGTLFTVTLEESNYGTWYVYVADSAGNKTATYNIGLYYRSDFGNLAEISKGYTVATWYETVLPTKYYSTNTSYPAATYYFADYDSALAYAAEAEWSRVTATANGWSYASLSNASTFVEYTDYATLVSVIDYYAATRVSERKIYSSSGSGPDNTSGTLTVQDITMPSVLSGYSAYELRLVQHTFSFTSPTQGVSGNTRYATIQYLSDGYTLREGSVISITYGTAIKSVLTAGDCYLQGYFLVTENDLCGNVQVYVLYLDLDIPELKAAVVYGSGATASLSIDEKFVTDNEGVMRYSSFEISSLSDSTDSYSFVVIDGKNLSSAVYLNTDELPVLTYANGYYGVYTITIYDRSLNSLSFSITIAGEAPSISTTSLTNETRVKVTISINDSDNVISEVHIYKITYYGEYEELSEDDAGTVISSSTSQYIIKTGGKYAVSVTDAFGRSVSIEFFYEKGLPSGTLSGVKADGITNSDVTFKYSVSYTAELYVYDSSASDWTDADSTLYSTAESSSTNTITIIASETTSKIYKIFLYVTEDKNLYMEYEFEIDCIVPSVQICTDNGVLAEGDVTTSPFYIMWTEASLTATYTTSKSSLYTTSYSKGTYLNTDYVYYFTVTDTAGNAISFEITLDSTVSYTLTGSYTYTTDGAYASKKSLTFTVNEQIGSWECESDNGLTVTNAQTITANGTYRISVTDVYGNAMQITLIIDNIAPTPVITTSDGQTVEKNGSTNKAFTVTCDEAGATITYSLSDSGYTAYDGSELSDSVKYYFTISDIYGNSETFTVTCDYTVSYTVNGTYTQLSDTEYVTARSSVTITVNESYSVFDCTSDNGYTYAAGEKFAQEGSYVITITDLAGNTVVLSLTVDKTAPVPVITAKDGRVVEQGGSLNCAFTVSCAEADATITYSADNNKYYAYGGEELSDSGKYYFKIADVAGNVTSFTVTCDYVVDYTVNGTYTQLSDTVYITARSTVYITVNEKYSVYDCTSDNGYIYAAGDKFAEEGSYSITITDLAGNTLVLSLTVDKTAPVPVITAADGRTVEQDGSVNNGFTVSCAEADATITYSSDSSKYYAYGGEEFSDGGKYYFKITDVAGNVTSFTVTCDYAVDYTLSGTYTQLSDTEFITARANVYLTINESYASYSCTSDNGYTYAAGEKFAQEGSYVVTITDLAGNTVILYLTVDFTAPEAVITAADGRTVEYGDSLNCAFTVTCAEADAVITYSTDNSKFYAYGGEEVSDSGTYYFKVTDAAGNVTSFTLTCDYAVKYTLSGTYTQLSDTEFITAKSNVYITVNESYAVYSVTSDNGYTYAAGEKFAEEGSYVITITDLAGNTVVLALTVDKTAPVPVITAADGRVVEQDGSLNCGFTVSCAEADASVTYSTDGNTYYSYAGTEISASGKYYFKIADVAGNVTSFTVTCDYAVSYTVNGTYTQLSDTEYITSKSNVYITVNEDYAVFDCESDNGYAYAAGEKFAEEGSYVITITDLAGNTLVLSLKVDKTAPEAVITAADGRTVEKDGSISCAFTVTCAEADAAITYSTDGISYAAYGGESCNNICKYYFKITDVAGNVTSFTVTRDSAVNVTITGSYTQDSEGTFFFKNSFTLAVNESYAVFDCTSDNGIEVTDGTKVTEEGTYVITVTDIAGNTETFKFVIDRTAPVPVITAADGRTVEMNGSVNCGFTVSCAEADATITYSADGSNYGAYSGEELSASGTYHFRLTDVAGNVTSFTVTCDYAVKYTIGGTYTQLSDTAYITAKANVYITVNEDYAVFDATSDTGFTYAAGEKLAEEGVYTVTITDLAGNTVILTVTVDFTAPEAVITAADGRLVEQGDSLNCSFTVSCAEAGATITYSTDNSKYSAYVGSAVSASGKYYFKITDVAGNVTSFTLTCDYAVKYTVNGTYTQLSDTEYITAKSTVYITVGEDYAVFDVTSDNGYAYAAGDKFAEEGSYVITITDLAGNTVVLYLTVDKTAPGIELQGAENGGKTAQDVIVTFSEKVTVNDIEYAAGESVTYTEEGSYTITAADVAGNKASVSFKIDKSVDVTVSQELVYGQVVTGTVSFTFNETITSLLTKDGVQYTYSGGKISENGSYSLTLADALGNTVSYSFTIISAIATGYSFYYSDNYTVEILKDEALYAGGVTDNSVTLAEDGNYVLTFTSEEGSFTVELTVDTVSPTVEITKNSNSVVIANPSKANVTVTVYKDGQQVSYTLGDTITDTGSYVVVVEDELGNSATYNFTLEYINGYGIALIAIACAAVVSIAVVAIVMRRKQSLR